MPTPSEIVDAQISAYNARDLEQFVGCFASTIVVSNAAGDVLAEGHDGLRAMYGPLFDASPELNASITNRCAVGDFVADHEQVTGFNLPGFPTSLQALAVYQVAEGAIAREWLFF